MMARTKPDTIISFKVIKRDEKAKADAGVAIGRMNAKLLGRITVIVANAGLTPNSGLILKTGGIKIAITAELLMKVVRRKDIKAAIKRKLGNESPAVINIRRANQRAAPDSAIALPKQIAPPYIRIIAQLT